ncbi:MAG: hypothetical protein H7210_10105 [Pyrinomonadaceae bacterium]|nr:hypothetical protein [Phycisphaerales bacterium]
MFKCAVLVATAAMMSHSAPVRADHLHQLYLRATIHTIEGNGPSGISPGDTISATYVFDINTPDADPDPEIGRYEGAVRTARARVGFPPFTIHMSAGPVAVINDSVLGDVYHVTLSDDTSGFSVIIDIVDGDAGASTSDAIMTNFDLSLYNGKSDIARMVLFGPISAPPESRFSLTATIDFVEATPVFCRCDWNQDDHVNSQDFFDFMADFFNGGGDFIPDMFHNTSDVFEFLMCFFNPEPYCP